MYEAFPVSPRTETYTSTTDPTSVDASSSLHACSRLESGDAICRYSVLDLATEELVSVRVVAGQVKEVNPSEYHEKTTQQRYGVDSIRSIEAPEEYERCAQSSRRERYVVQRINTAFNRLAPVPSSSSEISGPTATLKTG